MMRLLPAAKPTALLVVIEFIRMEDVPLVQPQRRRRRRRRHVALLCDVTVVVHKGASPLTFFRSARPGETRERASGLSRRKSVAMIFRASIAMLPTRNVGARNSQTQTLSSFSALYVA